MANISARQQPTASALVRRDEIVQQAARLFDRIGYHQTSMDDIAAAVGIRKPTLYHYFAGKDEILYAIHQGFIELLISRHLAREEREGPLSPKERLLGVMTEILVLIESHRGHIRVFFEHYRELAEDKQLALTARRDEYFRMVEDVVEEGIARKEFAASDARLTTLWIFGMCNWSYQWYRAGDGYTAREIAERFWELALGGLEVDG